ncbi:MAG: zf-HC2 domain-containing protein [Ignavibacteriae bacterium]|nr:zf-HC2 domain-containing protein [Ignavibacteriota bacterium]
MKAQKHVRDLLYDFHRGELSQDDRRKLEEHLAGCKRCAKAAEEIRVLMQTVPVPQTKPSDALSERYWDAFSYNVMNRVRSEENQHSVRKISFAEYLRSVFLYQRRSLAAISVGLTIVAVVVLTRQFGNVDPPGTDQLAEQQGDIQTPTVQARLDQYFRKSQILMVGLMNMKPENGNGVDLSVEQAVSRELIREARFLSQQNIDERTRVLIANLEKILIELANMEKQYDLPDIEILRAGINQENLLFKLRMGEGSYTAEPLTQDSERNLSQKGESL